MESKRLKEGDPDYRELSYRSLPFAYMKINVHFSHSIKSIPQLNALALKASINDGLKEIFGLVEGSVIWDLFSIDQSIQSFIVRVPTIGLLRLQNVLFFRTSYQGLKCKFEIVQYSPFLPML